MLRALELDGGIYNVGTGAETSVVGLYDAIRTASGVDREPAFAPARLGELHRSVLDASLAERELGWRPEHTLAGGLAATWEWMSSQ
jgi:UDP-glucose 4-epimerase